MSSITLPEGWLSIKIADVSDVQGGKRLPKGSEFATQVTAHPYLRVTDFGGETVDVSNLKYIDDETFQQIKNYIISKNDLYISIAGTIGLVGDIPEQLDGANLTENAAKICNIYGVEKVFLKRYLNSSVSQSQFDDKTVSSGQPKLALFRIRDCDFPLPPLAEQQQIAQKLDELLAQVDTLKTRLDAIPKILKHFRQSVLAAAVSGRLTEEWRENVDLPTLKDKLKSEWVEYQLQLSSSKGKKLSSEALVRKYREPEFLPAPDKKLEKWITLSLKYLILEKNQGVNTTTEKVVYSSSGIPAIQAGNIGNRHIEYNSEKFISEEKFNELSDSVKPTLSDVLYTNIGANFGNAAVVKKNEIQFVITWNVLKIRPSKELNSDYLAIVLNTEKIRAEAWSSVSTSTVPFVNGKKVDEFQIPLPPLAEQTEIVLRVEQLFAYADQIEQRVKDAQARVNHLTQSILAKAFRGELTADWRAQNPELISGENSAAALLERIRAERAAAAKPKKKVAAR